LPNLYIRIHAYAESAETQMYLFNSSAIHDQIYYNTDCILFRFSRGEKEARYYSLYCSIFQNLKKIIVQNANITAKLNKNILIQCGFIRNERVWQYNIDLSREASY